jgi:hypothetical protein
VNYADFNLPTMAPDNCSGQVAITYDPPSGTTFKVGSTIVQATAIDAAGNAAEPRFFEVEVLFSIAITGPEVLCVREGARFSASQAVHWAVNGQPEGGLQTSFSFVRNVPGDYEITARCDPNSHPTRVIVCVIEPGKRNGGSAKQMFNFPRGPDQSKFNGCNDFKLGAFDSGVPQLDITPYFDCTLKKWRPQVNTITMSISWWAGLGGLQPASLEAATEQNYCKMIRDLEWFGLKEVCPPEGLQWYSEEAVQAHEQAHTIDLTHALRRELAGFEGMFEDQVMIDHQCGMSAEEARQSLLAHPGYVSLVNVLFEATRSLMETYEYDPQGKYTPSPVARAAEAKVVRNLIKAIEVKAKDNGWAPCKP